MSSATRPWILPDVGLFWLILGAGETISQKVIRHNGGTGRYRSYLGFTVDWRFGVVVLCNTLNNADALGRRVLREMAHTVGEEKAPP